MTPEIILVIGVLCVAILLFIFEWVRVDVVGIIMMVCLPLLGLVSAKEAISGLSSNAVVSIIAVIIIGAGLDKTGAMNSLARLILKFAGKSEARIVTLISSTVAVISSFMQNQPFPIWPTSQQSDTTDGRFWVFPVAVLVCWRPGGAFYGRASRNIVDFAVFWQEYPVAAAGSTCKHSDL